MDEIELHAKPGSYRSGGYSVKLTREKHVKSKFFEKLTYTLKYTKTDAPRANEVKFLVHNYYNGTNDELVYDEADKPVDLVEIYISKFNKINPLVIGFKSGSNSVRYFSYNELKCFTTSKIREDSFPEEELFTYLISLDSITNLKIKFYNENGFKENVKTRIESLKSFKKVTYTPELKDGNFYHRMYANSLFDRYKTFNFIPSNFLQKIVPREFNAICVYYNSDRRLGLMAEFIDDCNVYQIYRDIDNEWEYERIEYNETDEQLLAKLTRIYEDITKRSNYYSSYKSIFSEDAKFNTPRIYRLNRRKNTGGAILGAIFGVTFFIGFILLFPICLYQCFGF